MMPLQWPSTFQQPAQASWLKQLVMYFMGYRNYVQVKNNITGQLLARPRPDPQVWGDDPLRIRTAQVVCKRAQEAYSWPNDHFLPDDPFDIVFLIPWDDLEIVEVIMQLEEDLGININDSEAEAWGGTALGNVVSVLFAKCKS